MPRIAEARAAARPSSRSQVQRHERILDAAARLGAAKGIDGVQMHDVAREAEVAIATLYRYFPSKTHLFTALLGSWYQAMGDAARPHCAGLEPVEAVTELLTRMARELLAQPLLAVAMMRSAVVSHATAVAETQRITTGMHARMLDLLGVADPDEDDVAAVRLLGYAWWSVVTAVLDGHLTVERGEADVRMAARLLLGPVLDRSR